MSTTTCPYCNAAVPLALPLPVSRRVTCPRCGELVPVKGEDALAGATGGTAVPPVASVGQGSPRSSWTNRQIGLTVLGLMAFIAAVALGYALKTVELRRSRDKVEEERAPVAATVVPPADLAGVGYLPDDVQLIAGVRVSAARVSEPARVVLAAFGVATDGGDRVLGLAADDVDHLILAASLKALPPRLTLVLRTRRPINADTVRTALQAGRGGEHNGKTLYEVKLRPKGPDGLIWFPNDRTIVGGLVREHFDKLPDPPNPFARRFPSPLPALLQDRLNANALAWAAVHVEADDPTQNLLFGFLPIPAEEQAALVGLQDLAMSVWVEGQDVRLATHVRGRDKAATERLGDAVERSLGRAGVVLNERAGDGGWLRLTAKEDAKALAKWLNRAKPANGP